jgi:hypothetical protein
MAEYQNIFTQVQIRAPAYVGVPVGDGPYVRLGKGKFFYWLGKIGDAQVGPFYLGWLGLASLICGITAVRDHRPQHVGLGELGPNPVRPPATLACPRAAAASAGFCIICPLRRAAGGRSRASS